MKIKKIQILIFLVLANFLSVHSQNIKTYTGVFDNGKATYSYFENDSYERIYQGKFIYNENVVKYDGLKLNINGNFINDKRDGEWSFIVKNTKSPVVELVTEREKAKFELEIKKMIDLYNALDAPIPYEEIQKVRKKIKNSIAYQTYYSELKGSYLQGKLNGIWSYKILTCSNCQPIISIVNFKNNKLNGNFSYIEKYSSVLGQFDENGEVNGKWIIKWKNSKNVEFENIRNYENGKLIKMIERNLITGDILYQNDSEELFEQGTDYREGNGIKLMIEAIEFWLQPKDDRLSLFGYIDDTPITNRNYSFRFDRGIIKPINPFIYRPVPSDEEENLKEEITE